MYILYVDKWCVYIYIYIRMFYHVLVFWRVYVQIFFWLFFSAWGSSLLFAAFGFTWFHLVSLDWLRLASLG